ncbi:MAG: hypothetical protein ACRDLO_06095 [Solirubrobacterales bacterium]
MNARTLTCIETTAWVDEDPEAAVRFLGQLSGHPIAVEDEPDEQEYRARLRAVAAEGEQPAFCERLWLIEGLVEADARAVGLQTLAGIASPGWRAWIGAREFTIWRDASCARRSIKLRYAGVQWWRAQLQVAQTRAPGLLTFSDCRSDPPAAPHDAAIRYGG